MEKVAQPLSISCFLHPSESIMRINGNLNAKKQLYCLQCVLEDTELKPSQTRLINIQEFLNNAASFYRTERNYLKTPSDSINPPSECLEILSRQTENLEMLKEHLNTQKMKIERVFEEITESMVAKINKKKFEYLQNLNDQFVIACQNYKTYEKHLRHNFPKPEDLDILFPSKEDLDNRLSGIASASELNSFLLDIKGDMKLNQKKPTREAEEDKEKIFGQLTEKLMKIMSKKPIYDLENFNVSLLGEELEQTLSKSLEESLKLDGSLGILCPAGIYPESRIISSDDFAQIREWLPDKYEFDPKLIYYSDKNLVPKEFHDKCDKKGPTLTLIKCKYQGFSKTSIIGGFLDKNWCQGNVYIESEEAFIFSLTSKVKCPILKQHKAYASYGQEICGPVFGTSLGNDILIYGGPGKGTSTPSCYENSASIIDAPNFEYSDIEVYTLK